MSRLPRKGPPSLRQVGLDEQRDRRRDGRAHHHCGHCRAIGHTRPTCALVELPRAEAMASTEPGRAELEATLADAVGALADVLVARPWESWPELVDLAQERAEMLRKFTVGDLSPADRRMLRRAAHRHGEEQRRAAAAAAAPAPDPSMARLLADVRAQLEELEGRAPAQATDAGSRTKPQA